MMETQRTGKLDGLPLLLSLRQVCEYTGLSHQCVRELVRAGRLREWRRPVAPGRLGSRAMYYRDSVVAVVWGNETGKE